METSQFTEYARPYARFVIHRMWKKEMYEGKCSIYNSFLVRIAI